MQKKVFQREDVKAISIVRTEYEGGAFHEIICNFWEISMIVKDYDLLMHQGKDVLKATHIAKNLSRNFDNPLIEIAQRKT